MQYDLFGRLESHNQIKKYKRNQISSGELLIVSHMTSNWKIVEIQNKISVLSTIIQKHEFLRAWKELYTLGTLSIMVLVLRIDKLNWKISVWNVLQTTPNFNLNVSLIKLNCLLFYLVGMLQIMSTCLRSSNPVEGSEYSQLKIISSSKPSLSACTAVNKMWHFKPRHSSATT